MKVDKNDLNERTRGNKSGNRPLTNIIILYRLLIDKTGRNRKFSYKELKELFNDITENETSINDYRTIKNYINAIKDAEFIYFNNNSFLHSAEDETEEKIAKADVYYEKEGFEIEDINYLAGCISFDRWMNRQEKERLISILKKSSREVYENKNNIGFASIPEYITYDEMKINIFRIKEAITKNKKIRMSFNTVYPDSNTKQYGKNKTIIKCRELYRTTVSPYMFYENKNIYYLVCIKEDESFFRHYRIDLLKKIWVTDEECTDFNDIRRLNRNKFADEHNRDNFNAFGDEPISISLKVKKKKFIYFVDAFGSNFTLDKNPDSEEDYYYISVTASPLAMRHFAIEWHKQIEVVSPVELVIDIKKDIEELHRKYNVI